MMDENDTDGTNLKYLDKILSQCHFAYCSFGKGISCSWISHFWFQ